MILEEIFIFDFFPYKLNPLNKKKTEPNVMDFFFREKGSKKKNHSKMDNQVVNLFGIDQGKRFVFCCGPQIDLWTELRAEKWSKKHVFWGLDPALDPKFRRRK